MTQQAILLSKLLRTHYAVVPTSCTCRTVASVVELLAGFRLMYCRVFCTSVSRSLNNTKNSLNSSCPELLVSYLENNSCNSWVPDRGCPILNKQALCLKQCEKLQESVNKLVNVSEGGQLGPKNKVFLHRKLVHREQDLLLEEVLNFSGSQTAIPRSVHLIEHQFVLCQLDC